MIDALKILFQVLLFLGMVLTLSMSFVKCTTRSIADSFETRMEEVQQTPTGIRCFIISNRSGAVLGASCIKE